jgi:hypothetical protein
MSNQVYYVLARVGADSIGLYVESPDFDSAYNVAQERIAQSYKGPFTVQALQLIDVIDDNHVQKFTTSRPESGQPPFGLLDEKNPTVGACSERTNLL